VGRNVDDILGGQQPARISNCYTSCDSVGKRISGDRSGGLVGWNTGGPVTNCYATGIVSGNAFVGGLVGNGWGVVLDSLWDMETSGWTVSDGGIGKTTAEMQTASTFLEAGWDFLDETENGTEDIWWILEGQDYPRLWWEASGQ